MNEFVLPELYCPFPSQVNKYVDVLEEHALEWVVRFNLIANESAYQHFCKSKIFFLIAGSYPYCQLEELKIANDWLTWMIFLDDYYDISELGKNPVLLKCFHKRLLEILRGAEVTEQDKPFGYALIDLRERTLQRGNTKWFNFFVQALQGFLDGCVQEAANRSKEILPDIDTYIILRRLTGGMEPLFELIEFCNHLNIPYSLRRNDTFKKLKMMTNNIICWCNDVYSTPKELAIGDNHNLVLLFCNQKKISLEQAIKHVAELHDQEVRSMLNLEASIPFFGQELDVELAKFISSMHTWISSHLNWYSYSGRYETVQSLELVTSLDKL
jgi:5-epi-alpha-selinene synthase